MSKEEPFDYWGTAKAMLKNYYHMSEADFHAISMNEFNSLLSRIGELEKMKRGETGDRPPEDPIARRAWVEEQARKQAHRFRLPDKPGAKG